MRRVRLPAFLLASGLALSCSSKDATFSGVTRSEHPAGTLVDVSVNATYPTDAAQTTTNSLHVWVVVPTSDAGTTCSDLVGGKTDPYDPTLELRGDAISASADKGTAKGVQSGKVLVYVEAVDFGGNVQWAGCKEVTVGGSSTPVSITLGKARVYDCANKAVKDGAPCDDGKLCTVGDTCKDGECQAGGPKDCTGLTNDCTVGSCVEDKGCVAATADDGTPCDDKHACTTGDVCKAGTCGGALRDCTKEAGPCGTSSACDESYGGCVIDTVNAGAPCDDGLFCTDQDTCNYAGKCTGQPHCGTGDCGVVTCNETMKRCDVTSAQPSGTYCSDGLYCTSGDTCDGAGKCVGTPVKCTSGSTCQTSVCSEASFGSCTSTAKPLGTACDDGSQCTTGDQCDTYGSCSGTYSAAGTACDDGSSCTLLDLCDGYGACYGTTLTSGTSCTGPCITSGYCSGSTCYANTYAAANTVCDDGNSCTTGDRCDAYGACSGTTSPTCL